MWFFLIFGIFIWLPALLGLVLLAIFLLFDMWGSCTYETTLNGEVLTQKRHCYLITALVLTAILSILIIIGFLRMIHVL
ncbi:hypothetical protein KS4_30510 [Poriferisphaera corsica]|uniref:Uncharacterized protein n=1 Tax=Poriferisphaera corsica TaxID=2528020 RepID=A0A517YXM5_9BACT|nr:hypothetical protein KS4_30510 [Poriferisphaera corsica]